MIGDVKPKIAILSIRNSYGFGGVLATLKSVYTFCETYFEPTVFYLSFDKDISAHFRPPQYRSKMRATTFFGMRCIEIGARWAFWEPGHYAFTKSCWAEALRDYDYVFVVSATPIAGHPAALLNKKFLIWISTSYDQDRIQRIEQLGGLRKLIDRAATPFMHRIEKAVLEKASYLLALSNYSLQQFNRALGQKRAATAICGYPLKPQKISPLIRLDEKKIIAIGRFSDPRKNLPMLLRVFQEIYEAMPEATLTIIGQTPDLTSLPRSSSSQAITFVGQVSQEKLRHFYATANLMLITSYQEGFGIAGLEGLLHGVPVVSTDCGGVSDYVINQLSGYLVPINDVAEMAKKSLATLRDQNLQHTLAAGGQALALQQFSEQKIHAQFKYALGKIYPELTTHFHEIDTVISPAHVHASPVDPLRESTP